MTTTRESGSVPLDDPPDHSPQSAAFLARLREHLRSRLFGSTQQRAEPELEDAKPAEGDLPGRIGRYDVIGRIGSGGMGVIYSAFDRGLGRKVAVKLLNPRGARSEHARARLLREAKALARLSHPNIVHVYEVGTHDDGVFVAMEFVEGTTLRKWQTAGDRSWRQLLAAYTAAGAGVAAGHVAGVVHRDFKPDNVLVSREGEVRVIDFGLARTQADEVAEEPEVVKPEVTDAEVALTKTGTLMGTPAYMAPEQFKGEPADARSDQFAFCIALYEALYGYRPFAGTTVQQVAHNVLSGNVEPPPRYTDVPETVYRVLLRGLEVKPEHRYPDMKELLDEMPADAPSYVRWIVASVGALVVAGVGSLFGLGKLEDAERAAAADALRDEFVAARGAEAEARLRRAWGRSRRQRFNELMLGTAEELVDSNPTHALATLKRLDPSERGWLTPARLLAAEAETSEVEVRHFRVALGPITHLVADRTGERVAFAVTNKGVFMAGDATAALPGDPFEVSALAMSDDSRVVAAAGADGMVRVWNDATQPAAIWSKHGAGSTAVSLSADGSTIAAGGADGRVVLGRRDGGNKQVSRDHKGAVTAVALSGDGAMLASAGEDKQVRIAFLGEPRKWVLPHRGGVRVKSLAFSGGGSFLDCLGEDGWIWRVRTDERRGALLPTAAAVTHVASAPGVAPLAVYGPGQPLRVFPGSEQPARELTTGSVTALALSGDGRVVVAAGADQSIRQWKARQRAESTYQLRDAIVLAMAYTPVGSRLAIGTSSGVVRLWDLVADETPQIGQLVGGVHGLTFSPDGTRLAALGGLGGISIWTLGGDDEPLSLLPAEFEPPIRWGADGSRIAAQLCDAPRRCGLVVHDLDAEKRLLATPLGSPLRSFGVSEGGRYAIAIRRGNPDTVQLFDLQAGDELAPPWPEDDRPTHVIGFRFASDATYVRLAAREAGRLALWHWAPHEEVLTILDEVEVTDVIPDAHERALLLRGRDGDDLWVLDEPLRRPIGPLPERVDHFELSDDRELVLVVSEGEATLIHVATGVRRTLTGIEAPFAWLGLSAFAVAEEKQRIRLRDDPTPSDPRRFLEWLARATDAVSDDFE